jgi:hypothetical protein
MSNSELQSFADSSFHCVSQAQSRIPEFDSLGAVDKLGFALNAVGPIALMANAKAGRNTNFARQLIINANQQIQDRLSPTCVTSVDRSTLETPGPSGPVVGTLGAVTGYGVCYNYKVPTPPKIYEHITYIPSGPNRGVLPNPVTGDVVAEKSGPFTTGYHIDWPDITDFSIAVNQAMEGTGFQVADGALDQLLPEAGPSGSPIAMTRNGTNFNSPIDAFRADGADSISRSVLTPRQTSRFPSFSGWAGVDGALRSVASAENADGRVELFGLTKAGKILHRWQQTAGDNNSWSPWAQL